MSILFMFEPIFGQVGNEKVHHIHFAVIYRYFEDKTSSTKQLTGNLETFTS